MSDQDPVLFSLPDLLALCASELTQCALQFNESGDNDDWRHARALERLADLCEAYSKKCGG